MENIAKKSREAPAMCRPIQGFKLTKKRCFENLKEKNVAFV